MPEQPLPRLSPWLIVLFSLALATVLGAIAAGQHHLLMVHQGGDLTIQHALLMGMPYWYGWALIAPLVVWFCRRVPLEGPRLTRRLVAHAGFAIGMSLLHSTLEVGFASLIGLLTQGSVLQFTRSSVSTAFSSLGYDLMAYSAIIGTFHAFSFYRRLREREIAASRLAAQLAQARLEALRNQLKPHFFFNAMNTVAMLVRAGDNTLAIRTLSGMSDLLRHVLQDDPSTLVPLREELEFIERYLAIEQIRFNDRLRFSLEADESAREAMVPNLLLQPLVENAVRHGIGARAGASLIEVRASIRDGRLMLSVTDDGPGFHNRAARSDGEGVGLRNTRARLREHYPDQSRLDLRNAPGGGAIVSIELPVQAPAPTLEPAPA
jgi:two-component sensor histidine kinase